MNILKFVSEGNGSFRCLWNNKDVDGCDCNAEKSVTQAHLVIARAIRTVLGDKWDKIPVYTSAYSEGLKLFDIIFEDKEGQPERYTIGDIIILSEYMIEQATPFR